MAAPWSGSFARFGWVFLEWVSSLLSPGERLEVIATAERAVHHVDDLDDKVGRQPDDAFVSVGVFGGRGREAYLAESRAVLEEKVVRRLRSFG